MILVIAEQRDGKLNRATWETIAGAQQLAGLTTAPISVLVPGAKVNEVAGELAAAQAKEVITIEHAALELNVDASAIREKPEPPFQQARQAVDLSQAERIVSVGRGIKEQTNIALAQQLAHAIGAEIAASRPICDAGWLPMERQVGSSGQTVAPKLYLALGISGAIQHLVGMKGANTVVAINKDPDAPIFEIADYGIVGDLFEIVPAIIEAVKK
jgi:electron transfer flavoprotein alpha subunit